LIEALLAAAIMATALVAVASLFAYATRTSYMSEQMSTSTFLVNSKLEDIRDRLLSTVPNGGSLDPAAPVTNFVEYVTIDPNGSVSVSTTDNGAPFIRLWQVSGTSPRKITLAVYARRNGVSEQTSELARATLELSNGS
jgi:Tfp pilus assembly protein PilV